MSSEYIQLPMLSETIDDSEDTSEHSDDEGNVLDEPECRICFIGSENENLIHPCLCSGGYKYVHRSCLERWRDNNRGTIKYHECEVCQEPYTVVYIYEDETLFLPTGGRTCCGMYLLYIGCFSFPTSFLVSFLDEATKYGSLSILGGGRPSPALVKWIQRDPIFYGSYYLSLTSYAGAMILFPTLAMYVLPRLKRGKLYRRGMVGTWWLCLLTASAHLFCYLIFILTGDPQTYFSFIGVSTIPTVLALRSLTMSHNDFLYRMNTSLNEEIVQSIEDGPSFEIEIDG